MDSIWPKRENEQFFRFFNKDYQLIVRAAKILSVLGESKDVSLHNFLHGLAALPCCNEKWQIQHGQHCSCLYVWKPIILRSKGITPQICFFLGSVSYDKPVYKILLENLFLFSRFSHLKSLKMSLSMTFDRAWQATTTTGLTNS